MFYFEFINVTWYGRTIDNIRASHCNLHTGPVVIIVFVYQSELCIHKEYFFQPQTLKNNFRYNFLKMQPIKKGSLCIFNASATKFSAKRFVL